MKHNIEVFDCLCSTSEFIINGIIADSGDFGSSYDASPETAEDYACGNRIFESVPYTDEVLAKYKITPEEYKKIADELTKKLSFGSCGWCV